MSDTLMAWTLLAFSEAVSIMNEEQRMMLQSRLEQRAGEEGNDGRLAYFTALQQLLEQT